MRRTLFFWVAVGILTILCYLWYRTTFSPTPIQLGQKQPNITSIPHSTNTTKATSSIFVPYWTTSTELLPNVYDTAFYFGVSVDKNGIDMSDDGYKKLHQFINMSSNIKYKILTIRMVQANVNEEVLQNKTLRNTIITQSLEIAKEYGFDGILLDFEYNALAFDSVVNSISNFSTQFANDTHKEHVLFFQSVYGDTFFRFRPYDIQTIASNADGIIVMAYDFHKAQGDPGPNFPLYGKETSGYDFSQMVTDFLGKVPNKKIILAFGLYGYDWEVNEKNLTITPGTPIALSDIQKKFYPICSFDDCQITRDTLSTESKIVYKDENGKKHILWFEDMNSIKEKTTFLYKYGINSVAYWAYSYF